MTNTNIIKIGTLNNAEMRIKNDNGWTIKANIRYNHKIIHVTFYRWLPKYQGNEPVQITDRVLIHDWTEIEASDFEAVKNELFNIFNEIAASKTHRSTKRWMNYHAQTNRI